MIEDANVTKPRRKIIHIEIGTRYDDDGTEFVGDRIYALANDGTVWFMDIASGETQWLTIHGLPQGPHEDIVDQDWADKQTVEYNDDP